jgi:hypothetical protein
MKIKNYKIENLTKGVFLLTLFIFAFGERVLFDMGPNIELITMALVLSSFYFGGKEAFWLTFAIIALSDRIIGNSNIFLFTWSGFLIPALLSTMFIRKLTINHQLLNIKKIFAASSLLLTGIGANIFFYFWTNFGVWLLSGMYAKTTTGLLMSYINALPFLRYQLTSTLIFVPLGFVLTEIAISLGRKYRLENKLKYLLSLNLI